MDMETIQSPLWPVRKVDILVGHFWDFKNPADSILPPFCAFVNDWFYFKAPRNHQGKHSEPALIKCKVSRSRTAVSLRLESKVLRELSGRWKDQRSWLTEQPRSPPSRSHSDKKCVPVRNLGGSSGQAASAWLESCPNLRVRLQFSRKIAL